MEVEEVQPADIAILYNGAHIRNRLETQVADLLISFGVELSVQTNKPFTRSSTRDDLADLLEIIGGRYRKWLVDLSDSFVLRQEPIISESGQVISEPLFWFKTDGGSIMACFRTVLGANKSQKLSELGVAVLPLGANPWLDGG